MYLERKRPTFKYASFAGYVAECRVRNPYRYTRTEKISLKYPCYTCGGTGRVIASWETSDPIEGHKLSDRVDCYDCKGTGDTTEEEYSEVYHEKLREYHEAIIKWDRLSNNWKKLNLSNWDWEALSLFGRDGPKE